NQRSYKYVSIPADAPAQKGMTPKQAAERVATMLRSDKKSDQAVDEFLKPFGVQVMDSPSGAENAPYLAGVQENPVIVKELFAKEGGLKVGQAKVYDAPTRILVVLVTGMKTPDPAKFESSRTELLQQVRARKERSLMNAVLKKL